LNNTAAALVSGSVATVTGASELTAHLVFSSGVDPSIFSDMTFDNTNNTVTLAHSDLAPGSTIQYQGVTYTVVQPS
jgi:hypothetical protein